jgi:hypothetical protein
MPRTGCFWCSTQVAKPTRDHLIPSWARVFIPPDRQHEIAALLVIVAACQKCNVEKGALPPAAYARFRRNPTALRAERHRWEIMAEQAVTMFQHMSAAERVGFVSSVIAAMSEDFPRDGSVRAIYDQPAAPAVISIKRRPGGGRW